MIIIKISIKNDIFEAFIVHQQFKPLIYHIVLPRTLRRDPRMISNLVYMNINILTSLYYILLCQEGLKVRQASFIKPLTYRALGIAGIEPTLSKSECDWTRFRLNHSAERAVIY